MCRLSVDVGNVFLLEGQDFLYPSLNASPREFRGPKLDAVREELALNHGVLSLSSLSGQWKEWWGPSRFLCSPPPPQLLSQVY